MPTTQVADHGLLGDRVYALLDRADGMVATAKSPRKWPNLFACRATLIAPPGSGAQLPPVRMTLPDGTLVTSAQRECHQAFFALPLGTFIDCATVHLLTTATLHRLRDCYPHGRFEVQRFRSNLVVEPVAGEGSLAEDAWIGHTLALGDEGRLRITGRCVMTTLAQRALPKDTEILRTAVQKHQGQVGVYAAVVRGGTIHRGDQGRLAD